MIFYTRMTFSKARGPKPVEVIEEKIDVPDLEIGLFRKRLAETMTWCMPRIDFEQPATCFRSKELEIDDAALDYKSIETEAPKVIARREALLQGQSLVPIQNNGRILIFFFDNCLYEGAVAAETRRYIGGNEFPPWDTWICTAGQRNNRFLVSWVPEAFVDEVNAGFLVMTIPWLTWVIATEPPL